MASSEAVSYGRAVARRLQEILGNDLRGAYLSGSVALGGYVPGQSDIDLFAVCQHSLEVEEKQPVAQAISDEAADCPTRSLEFVLYSREAVAQASRRPRFEINLNAGPEMDYHLSFDPASEPAHWFVLDISIVGEYGLRLIGPPAREVFARVPRPWLLEALEDSLEWHADHETLLHYSVLNACRSWRYAEEGVMSSKDEAAAWALAHAEYPSIIDSALAIRRGERSRRLDPAEVRAFVLGVKARIAQMPR
jgi:aminoglycoside adenylyltransferase-like protein